MTTKREIPIAADTLAWVHNELADLKSKLALAQTAADQSRGVASDAAEKALAARSKVDTFDAQGSVILHLQDDVRALREQLARAQDDIHSLRQSREEIERRALVEAERVRQDKNDLGRRFTDLERVIEGWQERAGGIEEHSRRSLEGNAQIAQRLEALESSFADIDTMQSRTQTAISSVVQDVQRLSSTIGDLQREDDVQRERSSSAIEMLRRLEGEIEALKTQTNRISRIDDRLELVQAEPPRHNERINEITAEITAIDTRLNEHGERASLVEARITNYQDELRGIKERLQVDREQISAYLHGLSELESDIRKRQIIALEKEIRDVRGRAINFAEE